MNNSRFKMPRIWLLVAAAFPAIVIVSVIIAAFDSNQPSAAIPTKEQAADMTTPKVPAAAKSYALLSAAPSSEQLAPPLDDVNPQTFQGVPVMVQVNVHDDTKANPMHDKAAIFVRGNDPWWIKLPAKTARQQLNAAGARKAFGPRTMGEKFEGPDAVVLYPDGYEIGTGIAIPFKLSEQMSPNGSDRDSIVVAISDEQVEVMGGPLEAATGHTSLLLRRSTGELLAAPDQSSKAEVDAEIAKIFDKGAKKDKPSATTDSGDKVAAWTMAEEFVKRHLKSPSTARFGYVFGEYQDPHDCVKILGDDKYQVEGWVDSQNSFGATVRSSFVLTIKDNGKSWSLIGKPVIVTRQ